MPCILEACKWLEATDPEHTYKYFPSQDAWTWEQEATEWDVKVWGAMRHVPHTILRMRLRLSQADATRHTSMTDTNMGQLRSPPIQHQWDSRSEMEAGPVERTAGD